MIEEIKSDSQGKLRPSKRFSDIPKACKCCKHEDLFFAGSKNDFELWQCRNCSFIFSDDGKASHSIPKNNDNHYDDTSEVRGVRSIEFLCPAFAVLPDRRMKIMDFGFGESYISERLRQMDHHVDAVNFTSFMPHDTNLLNLNSPYLLHSSASFDLIYSYEVFEQIAEPRYILNKIIPLLKKNGIILIHTNMVTEGWKERDFNEWERDRRSRYTYRAFELMFEEFGCKLIHSTPEMVMARKVRE